MIKRVFILVMVFSLLASPLTAYADAIMGNEFQWQNYDKMQPLGRSRFCVNGPDGYVSIREEPSWESKIFAYSNNKEITYQNGTELIMSSLYVNKGEYWGIMSAGHHVYYPGWIPMAHLLVVYIRNDFNTEYKNEFYTYNGNYDAVLVAKRLVLWQWPGSDREKRVLDVDGFELKDEQVLYAYKDKSGREWGYVDIGQYEWICLSDPENSQIPAFHPAPEPISWSPDGIYKWSHTELPDDGIEQSERYSLSHIAKVNTYGQNNIFTDVSENAWYRNAIATAYEYDIIKGKSNNIFDPEGNLTRGEALAIASRIHAYYKYGQEEGSGLIAIYNYTYNFNSYGWNYWWAGAVEYCQTEELAEKVFGDDKFGDFYHYYEAPITRVEMVHAWAKILQSEDMPKQNTVISLPDVDADTDYFEDILLFYEVGIIGGIDAQGTFNPDSKITRAEAATIFMNLIDTSKRHSGRNYKG